MDGITLVLWTIAVALLVFVVVATWYENRLHRSNRLLERLVDLIAFEPGISIHVDAQRPELGPVVFDLFDEMITMVDGKGPRP